MATAVLLRAISSQAKNAAHLNAVSFNRFSIKYCKEINYLNILICNTLCKSPFRVVHGHLHREQLTTFFFSLLSLKASLLHSRGPFQPPQIFYLINILLQ